MTIPAVRIFSYSRCSTCRKALDWLNSNSISYELFDIIENPPSKDLLLKAWAQLGERKFLFNTSGVSYRSIGAVKIKAMSDEKALEALVSDGKLIKRPFLVSSDNKILVGFKPQIWADFLLS
ncbi:arsenate reductase family protein [Prochlorococcus sp. MIT 1341]|uniref:arsenate reductase family protein n=1 Tax=Prochlorococcus sp. MIT 1341 TaxID=3096221 RepID=UPI002A7580A5|nr:arsenate reductase family protein [Prochlorococcus sp. MIT 1341]